MLSSRPTLVRTQRQPLHVGAVEYVSIPRERAAYLAVRDLADADEANERGEKWLPAKETEMHAVALEHDAWNVVLLPPKRQAISAKLEA